MEGGQRLCGAQVPQGGSQLVERARLGLRGARAARLPLEYGHAPRTVTDAFEFCAGRIRQAGGRLHREPTRPQRYDHGIRKRQAVQKRGRIGAEAKNPVRDFFVQQA